MCSPDEGNAPEPPSHLRAKSIRSLATPLSIHLPALVARKAAEDDSSPLVPPTMWETQSSWFQASLPGPAQPPSGIWEVKHQVEDLSLSGPKCFSITLPFELLKRKRKYSL